MLKLFLKNKDSVIVILIIWIDALVFEQFIYIFYAYYSYLPENDFIIKHVLQANYLANGVTSLATLMSLVFSILLDWFISIRKTMIMISIISLIGYVNIFLFLPLNNTNIIILAIIILCINVHCMSYIIGLKYFAERYKSIKPIYIAYILAWFLVPHGLILYLLGKSLTELNQTIYILSLSNISFFVVALILSFLLSKENIQPRTKKKNIITKFLIRFCAQKNIN